MKLLLSFHIKVCDPGIITLLLAQPQILIFTGISFTLVHVEELKAEAINVPIQTL